MAISRLVERIQRHLSGKADPFRDVALDVSREPPFRRKILEQARQIAIGTTISYTNLALLAGAKNSARAVGQAMARNPIPILIPCHRVIGARGALGGYSAAGELSTKLRLLSIEGADLKQLAIAGVRALKRADPRLAGVIKEVGPFRHLEREPLEPFFALVQAIVHQQVSMKAGATIFDRLRANVTQGGKRSFSAKHVLTTSTEDLRAVGLSRQKSSYIRDLAQKIVEQTLSLELLSHQDDERVIQSLTQVKGIGRWSAQMYLIFQMGRLDVLPVDDLGLRKGVQKLHGLAEMPETKQIRELTAPWRPFRSIATWYLWRSLEAGGVFSM
jgi:methylated-DNA-[protein]-cysteine S-methyltransferase